VGYREETITKDKLKRYIKYSKTIEIVPIKNEEPIFILKNFSPEYDILGYKSNATTDNIVIIHKGKFILGDTVSSYLFYTDFKSGKTLTKPMPDECISSEDYLSQHKSRMLPSKEFSMQSILDNTIQLKDSDISYLKYIREFLIKFKYLESKKGKYLRDNKETKERFEFVCNAYEQTKLEQVISLHQMSKVIQDMWFAKLAERYPNDLKAFNEHCCSLNTIRNDLDKYLKSKKK